MQRFLCFPLQKDCLVFLEPKRFRRQFHFLTKKNAVSLRIPVCFVKICFADDILRSSLCFVPSLCFLLKQFGPPCFYPWTLILSDNIYSTDNFALALQKRRHNSPGSHTSLHQQPVMEAGVTLIQPPNCEPRPGSHLERFGFTFERFSYGPGPVNGVSLRRVSMWHRCQESPPCRCMQEAHSCYWWHPGLSGDGVKPQIRSFIRSHTTPVIFVPEPKQNQDSLWIQCKVGD